MLTLERNNTSGFEMSEWSGRQEEALVMIGSFESALATETFKDREFPAVTNDSCICWAQHPTYVTGLR